jgi:site-specific recombinase XerD
MFLSKRTNGIWYLFIEIDGVRKKISTGSTRKPEALEFVRAFKLSEHQKKVAVESKTLSQLQKEFLEYSKGVHTLKTTLTFSVAFNEFIRALGDVQINTVDVRAIEQFLAGKTHQASQWSARKYYGSLASAFETAVRWKYLESNPFRLVKKPRAKEVLPFFFTKEQLDTLLESIADSTLRSICIVAAFTGMRLGEIVSLTWRSVDLPGRTITVLNSDIFTTKSKRHRVIPMNDKVHSLFASLATEQMDGLVFRDQRGKMLDQNEVSRDFKAYVRQLGFSEKLHFHSLRHSFCSLLAKKGVSIYTISKLAGHADVRTTQIYAHLSPCEMHDTVNLL